MSVKIRLSRFGSTHNPIYRIVAMDSRRKRDGKCLENLGTYNPMTGEFIQFHEDRINAWIEKGAQESDTVRKLHKEFLRRKAGGAPKPKKVAQKAAPKAEEAPKAAAAPEAPVEAKAVVEESAEAVEAPEAAAQSEEA